MISRCQRCHNEISNLGLHPVLAKQWGKRQKTVSSENLKNNRQPRLTMVPDSGSLPKIAGFEIYYQVGKGAMGCVYKARQISTGKFVAIKVLSKDLSLRGDLVARFEREAYALKALNHDNVVSIIDAGQAND